MAKILLIEDDPLVIRMYQKVLAFEGFEIDSAGDGRTGVEKAQTDKPDLIFCDVMMPKVNGIEVLERLKADPSTKDIPVIMLTNLSGTHDAEVALEKGAFAYLVKSEYKPREVAEKAKAFFKHLKDEQTRQDAPVAVSEAVQQTEPDSDNNSDDKAEEQVVIETKEQSQAQSPSGDENTTTE
jgi:CheY-like chemotaxis protein